MLQKIAILERGTSAPATPSDAEEELFAHGKCSPLGLLCFLED